MAGFNVKQATVLATANLDLKPLRVELHNEMARCFAALERRLNT